MNKVGGRIGAVKGMSFIKLGIYYSRHGILHLVPVDVVEGNPKLNGFIEWFVKRAKEAYPARGEAE